jgi:phage gpG-like protein
MALAGGGVVEVREDNSKQIADAISKAIAVALEEIGLSAERFAKRACPVDTGRLRNSITHVVNMDEKAAYIGTNVEYAKYVENGTSRRKGVYFLRGAAQDHGSYYRDIMKKHLENA